MRSPQLHDSTPSHLPQPRGRLPWAVCHGPPLPGKLLNLLPSERAAPQITLSQAIRNITNIVVFICLDLILATAASGKSQGWSRLKLAKAVCASISNHATSLDFRAYSRAFPARPDAFKVIQCPDDTREPWGYSIIVRRKRRLGLSWRSTTTKVLRFVIIKYNGALLPP
jgi:hypothetical protein